MFANRCLIGSTSNRPSENGQSNRCGGNVLINRGDIHKWGRGLESKKTDTEEEAEFRESYSHQLRGKKQQVYDSHMGHNALEEERKQVNQQAMKTPGRRGEFIKNEEIDKEISRRYTEHKKRNVIY